MDLFSLDALDIVLKLLLSLSLGLFIGLQRSLAHKIAGMRTFALVSMGSCLFVLVAEYTRSHLGANISDSVRLASQIVVGVGFLGAGLIVFKDNTIMGLTTASGLWVSSGIGIAVGFGFLGMAIIATFLTFAVFSALWYVEEEVRKAYERTGHKAE